MMLLNIRAIMTPIVRTYKVETALYPTTLSSAICMNMIGLNASTFKIIDITNAQINTYLHFHNSGKNHDKLNFLSLLDLPRTIFKSMIYCPIYFETHSN